MSATRGSRAAAFAFTASRDAVSGADVTPRRSSWEEDEHTFFGRGPSVCRTALRGPERPDKAPWGLQRPRSKSKTANRRRAWHCRAGGFLSDGNYYQTVTFPPGGRDNLGSTGLYNMQSSHTNGRNASVLFSSVFGPYAQDDEFGSRSINPMELYHNQVTRAQGAFSIAHVPPLLGHHDDPAEHLRAIARCWIFPRARTSPAS